MSRKPGSPSLLCRLTACLSFLPLQGGGRKTMPLVFTMVLMLSGCDDSPRETTLSALSAAQKDFNGRRVMVSGTLRTFDTPRHYWIENESLDRVALEGVTNLVPKVGQSIRVQGTFHYDQDKGRRIKVEKILSSP